jgi:hypothetical protein
MPTPTKAVLLQLNVALGTNNIRRNIGSFVANVENTNGDVRTVNTTVLANGGTYAHTAPAGNKVTVLTTDKPLTADVALVGGGGFTKTVSSMLVLDCEVATISVTNASLTDNANLVIING